MSYIDILVYFWPAFAVIPNIQLRVMLRLPHADILELQ